MLINENILAISSEQELVRRMQAGDTSAFEGIVATYKDMVYNTVVGIVQDAADAEDISQEVFVQVYESIRSFRGDAKFSTWLYRIAVTRSLDHLRKRKRKKRWGLVSSLFGGVAEQEMALPDFEHPGVTLENKERAAVLFQAIRQLPDKQQAAFVLQQLEGLSLKEISEVLGTSVAGVEGLLHRGKEQLRKKLGVYYKSLD